MATSSAIRRYFRTPKGLVLIVLAILVALAAPSEGSALVAPGVVSAVIVAGLIDAVILRWKQETWEFPDGAILTGLFVAMILSPQQPWYVAHAHRRSPLSASTFSGLVQRMYSIRRRWGWSPHFTYSVRLRTGGAHRPGAMPLGLVVLLATGVLSRTA